MYLQLKTDPDIQEFSKQFPSDEIFREQLVRLYADKWTPEYDQLKADVISGLQSALMEYSKTKAKRRIGVFLRYGARILSYINPATILKYLKR